MTSIISYSLFDQDSNKFNRSGHDPYHGNNYRYWLNLPFVIILNKIVFTEFITRLYIPKKLQENKYYPLLEELNEKIEHFELKIINKDYFKTEPAIWRIMPLWDDNVDFLFCRDLDSVIVRKEAQAMEYFIKSNLLIHNISPTGRHQSEGTSIMAGLCGFNVKKLKKELPLPKSFDKYMDFYNSTTTKGVWGCDQETLINFFLRYRSDRIINKTLYAYIKPKRPNKMGNPSKNKFYNMVSVDENVFKNIKFSTKKEMALLASDNITTWAGQPIDASSKNITKISSICNEQYSKDILSIIRSNNLYKNFYNI